MSFFGKLVKTVVNTALLPVAAAKDVVMVIDDAVELRPVGRRTKKAIETLKEEADD